MGRPAHAQYFVQVGRGNFRKAKPKASVHILSTGKYSKGTSLCFEFASDFSLAFSRRAKGCIGEPVTLRETDSDCEDCKAVCHKYPQIRNYIGARAVLGAIEK